MREILGLTGDVVLVHDYIVGQGGAELVLLAMSKAFPRAPIYTSIYHPRSAPPEFRDMDIRASFLQTMRPDYSKLKYLLPLFPTAFSRLALPKGATVLSSCSAFAKCIPNPGLHVCYCYTPPRFLWDVGSSSVPAAMSERVARTLLGSYLRRRDLEGAASVDAFIAISHEVSLRIRRIYRRNSEVIEAPTSLASFEHQRTPSDMYLVASRLLRYKRIDVAIRACTASNRKLIVVGDGPERSALEAIAGPSVTFMGHVPHRDVAPLMAKARAVIVCAEEDWGMVAIEAAAAGCPAIAADAGGNRETVVHGVTGLLFDEPYGPIELLQALDAFERQPAFDREPMLAHARRFDERLFIQRLTGVVDREMNAARQASVASQA